MAPAPVPDGNRSVRDHEPILRLIPRLMPR
jgi:hypothetical protein